MAYQANGPRLSKRKAKHAGFRARLKNNLKVLKRRRLKGRWKIVKKLKIWK